MKFVSQVFQFCRAEVGTQRIIDDNKVYFHQVAKSECGENCQITYEYVNQTDTEERGERERGQMLKDTGFSRHVEWHASVDYPSNKCR